AFRLAEAGMRVAIAERDKLGGECNHYGCVPTKVMLRSAKIAAWARDAGRFGVHIPSVEVDLAAVQQRARDVIDAQSGEGAAPFGSTVMILEALPHIVPNEDEASAAALVPALEDEGIELLAGVTIERAAFGAEGWRVDLAGDQQIRAEEVLVATGRRPVFDGH